MSTSIQVQFADDVRVELGNKFSIMGVYSGGMDFGVQPLPIFLPSLAIFITAKGLEDSSNISLTARSPNGAVISSIQPQPIIIERPEFPAAIFFKLSPFAVSEYGSYTFNIKIGEDVFSETLKISGATPV